jgi:hypothetical protein
MAELTPEQQAQYALGCGIPRDDLSPAAQLDAWCFHVVRR